MLRRCAISLLLSPTTMSAITSRSRSVILTSSRAAVRPRLTAMCAICENRVLVIRGGNTCAPSATDRMVPIKSSNVASFRMNPATPAFTNSAISSCTGRRSMTMTRASAISFFTVSARRREFLSCRPTSRRTTRGFVSFSISASKLVAASTTFTSGSSLSLSVMPSRTSRLSSMIATVIMTSSTGRTAPRTPRASQVWPSGVLDPASRMARFAQRSACLPRYKTPPSQVQGSNHERDRIPSSGASAWGSLRSHRPWPPGGRLVPGRLEDTITPKSVTLRVNQHVSPHEPANALAHLPAINKQECRRAAGASAGRPNPVRNPSDSKAPLPVYNAHVPRLTRHYVWRTRGNRHSGNWRNAGPSCCKVEVYMAARGNRKRDDRAGVGNGPVLHDPVPRAMAVSRRVDDASVDRRPEHFGAARPHYQPSGSRGRADTEHDAPGSVDQRVANQRGVGGAERHALDLSAGEAACVLRQTRRPRGTEPGHPDRVARPRICRAAERTKPRVARVSVLGVHQGAAQRMVGARMHRESGDHETYHTRTGEPRRGRPARVAGDELELRREQKCDERRHHTQRDRAGTGDAEHHYRNAVDETDEDC